VSRTVDESPGQGSPSGAEFPPRAELERHQAQVLKDDGPGAPKVVRYDLPDGPVVLKEWAPSKSRIFNWWSRSVMKREIKNHRKLSGTLGIPRFLGQYSEVAYLMQWVDAQPIRRRLPMDFKERGLDGLDRALAALHERRFVHLDLHQKLNALVAEDGSGWLIDLGQGIDCSSGPFRRLLFPWLARIDRRAIEKFRAKYAPHTLPEENREELVQRYSESRGKAWKEWHRKLRRRLLGDRR
jgi:RIO-like serine/threonine protein kinase